MTASNFLEMADQLARRAGVQDGIQSYFQQHRSRLLGMLDHFHLWEVTHARLLEIGPFFSYTPFLFQRQGNEVSVLEGNDPVVAPLLPLYQEEGIACQAVNLLRVFALATDGPGRLPYADGQFDAVVCFEMMEHLNFNPVVFVRELRRILKPGGRAYVQVPNLVKLDSRIQLLLGKTIRTPVDEYYQFADYNCGEFLGFHWREYALGELVDLFSRSQFQIEQACHVMSFQDRTQCGLGRRVKRLLGQGAVALVPSLATNCALIARKKAED
ncbi:MAG: class I SAM-dependent methyltransferase [Verrucomicrobia bacterium]|nr:class I SAM-dependent methyltransferase [Verrucomicrobiota bacterium]